MLPSRPANRLLVIVGGVFEPTGVGNVGVSGRSIGSTVEGAVVPLAMVIVLFVAE